MAVNRATRERQSYRIVARSVGTRAERSSVDLSFLNHAWFKAVFCIFYIVFAVSIVQGGLATVSSRVVSMQSQVKALTQANEYLRLDVAELKSPSRIQTIAEGQLGMVLPASFVYSSSRASVIQRNVVDTEKIRD